jgi:hypothetical protein
MTAVGFEDGGGRIKVACAGWTRILILRLLVRPLDRMPAMIRSDTPDVPSPPPAGPSPSGDLTALLAKLPAGGVADSANRLVEIYESAERVYRDASSAGVGTAGSSASSNL